MKKYRAVNVSTQFPSIKNLIVKDYKIIEESFIEGKMWGVDLIFEGVTEQNPIYVVPKGATARIMCSAFSSSMTFKELKIRIGDVTLTSINGNNKIYTMIKINDSKDDSSYPFAIRGVETQALTSYEKMPIYINEGDKLYARSALGSIMSLNTKIPVTEPKPIPEIISFEPNSNSSMIYFSILEEYDE